jgi:oxygen-independent coproporphyrinogen-3 oxidase
MDALLQQLHFELKHFKVEKNSIETLFIGGGTPSTVAPELYSSLFELLHPYMQKDAEITTEANPNSATQEWLEGMYALGVNRISFGVQSFDEKKLKLLNRTHTPQMAKKAINHAAKTGFKNISLDLIYATAGDTKKLLENDLNEAFALPINHLSAYALTIEAGTAFATQPQMAQEKLELTEWLFETIQKRGFMQYEISNFGIIQSRHNLGYWSYKDYIGLGAGAVGKYHSKRFYPNPNIESYIKNPLSIRVEELSENEIRNEKIFLGFRSCVGVKKTLLTPKEQLRATLLADEKKLLFKEGVFYNLDYLLADEIALYISD